MNAKQRRAKRRQLRALFRQSIALGSGWKRLYDSLTDLTIVLNRNGAWVQDSRGEWATTFVEMSPSEVKSRRASTGADVGPCAGDYARAALRALERAKWLVEGVDRDTVAAAIAQVEPLVGLGRGE